MYPDSSKVRDIVLPCRLDDPEDGIPFEVGWDPRRIDDPEAELADDVIDAFLSDPVLRGVFEVDKRHLRLDERPSLDGCYHAHLRYDSDSIKDFTECNKVCGYCGHCYPIYVCVIMGILRCWICVGDVVLTAT